MDRIILWWPMMELIIEISLRCEHVAIIWYMSKSQWIQCIGSKPIQLYRSFILSLLIRTWENWSLFFFLSLPSIVYFIFTFLIEKIFKYSRNIVLNFLTFMIDLYVIPTSMSFSQIEVEILLNRIMKDYIKSQ